MTSVRCHVPAGMNPKEPIKLYTFCSNTGCWLILYSAVRSQRGFAYFEEKL